MLVPLGNSVVILPIWVTRSAPAACAAARSPLSSVNALIAPASLPCAFITACRASTCAAASCARAAPEHSPAATIAAPVSVIHLVDKFMPASSPWFGAARVSARIAKATVATHCSLSRDRHDDVVLEAGPLAEPVVPGFEVLQLRPLEGIVEPAVDVRSHGNLGERERLAAEIGLAPDPRVDDFPCRDRPPPRRLDRRRVPRLGGRADEPLQQRAHRRADHRELPIHPALDMGAFRRVAWIEVGAV